MQLTSIRYAVVLAEVGNFTKAAERLYLSQAALSQSIARLEKELNVELFRRERSAVTLTPAGHILVEEGRKILAIEKNILDRLSDLIQSGTGHLTLGAAPSYQRYYLSQLISALQGRFPNMQIVIREGYSHVLSKELIKGTIDAALICEPVPENLYAIPVVQEEIFLALPPNHPLVEQMSKEGDPYPLADLSLCKNEPFIAYLPQRRITDIVLRETERAGFEPNILAECASTESANAMIYHGFGVGFVPATTVLLCPSHQRARYFRLRPGGLKRWIYLARKPGEYTNNLLRELFAIAKQLEWDELAPP